MDLPRGSDSKESAYNAGDLGSVPGLRRSPGERNGYPLQYSHLENSMDRNLASYRPRACKEPDMTEQFNTFKQVMLTLCCSLLSV